MDSALSNKCLILTARMQYWNVGMKHCGSEWRGTMLPHCTDVLRFSDEQKSTWFVYWIKNKSSLYKNKEWSDYIPGNPCFFFVLTSGITFLSLLVKNSKVKLNLFDAESDLFFGDDGFFIAYDKFTRIPLFRALWASFFSLFHFLSFHSWSALVKKNNENDTKNKSYNALRGIPWYILMIIRCLQQ